MTLAAVLCCTMAVPVLTSCSVEENPAPNPEPKELADATIIWYGTGAGNVDHQIMNNFRQFYKAKPETFDHVNIVAQYKVSATLRDKINEKDLKLMEEDLKELEKCPKKSWKIRQW